MAIGNDQIGPDKPCRTLDPPLLGETIEDCYGPSGGSNAHQRLLVRIDEHAPEARARVLLVGDILDAFALDIQRGPAAGMEHRLERDSVAPTDRVRGRATFQSRQNGTSARDQLGGDAVGLCRDITPCRAFRRSGSGRHGLAQFPRNGALVLVVGRADPSLRGPGSTGPRRRAPTKKPKRPRRRALEASGEALIYSICHRPSSTQGCGAGTQRRPQAR